MHKNVATIKNKNKNFSKYWRQLLFYHYIISLNKVFLPRSQIIVINWKIFFWKFWKKKFFSKILTFTPETNFEICQMSLSNSFWNLKLRNVKLVGFFISIVATFLYPRFKKYWSFWTQDTNFYLLVSCKQKLQKLRSL